MGKPTTNKISKATHSLNEDRSNKSNEMRSKAVVKRLKMYRNGKEKRNAKGEVIKDAIFQNSVASGKMARIQPNRKWFGNTRIISDKDIIKFKEFNKTYDPYQVTLKKSLMPITILTDGIKKDKAKITDLKPYFNTHRKNTTYSDITTWADLAIANEKRKALYNPETDKMITSQLDVEKKEASNGVFRAGTSHRLWNELFKVIDSSDVILYVLDVRDPQGTRSEYIENYLRTEKPTKMLVFVLNKVDLVPVNVTKQWRKILSAKYPTVAFYANMKHPFGKSNLISLLRQFQIMKKEQPQISVGIIGYPNVGKSSVINTLKNERVCNVAPIAGETKVWQYITLTKSVHLIDCPGVVNPHKASETELVLKGAVRVEKINNADMHIPAVMEIVKPEILKRVYNIKQDWKDFEDFLEIICRQSGRLLKGGVPDVQTVAKKILSDFQRGVIPYYVKPEGYDDTNETIVDFDEVKKFVRTQAKEEEQSAVEIEEEVEIEKVGESHGFEKDVEREDEEEDEDTQINEEDKEENMQVSEKEKKEVEREVEEKIEKQVVTEFDAGIKKKKKAVKQPQMKKQEPVKKLTSKQRRRMDRESRTKKSGQHYYDDVDLKMKRTKK